MKTEIFGTFGPACADKGILKEMITAGMTGMRLNLSHVTLPASKTYIENYQAAATECGVEPQILIDMQGPELRVGDLAESLDLSEGTSVWMVPACDYQQMSDEDDDRDRIPVPAEVIQAIETGDEILLDDGKILVQVRACECETNCDGEYTSGKKILVRVLRGGVLHSHKSIKVINKNIKMPVLTPHDIANIKVAKEYGVTALMQPFVLSAEDLRNVRQVLSEHSAEGIQIYAKIENRLGVDAIDDIVTEADVIIIARGDLGNDMPLWELPAVQKQLEEACKKADKPYIVVTQMLSSMETNPVPTRAEVSDIFHAVYHGAWGVMVTGETAIGKYPVQVIKYLANTSQQGLVYRATK